jgi:hypothetical protein
MGIPRKKKKEKTGTEPIKQTVVTSKPASVVKEAPAEDPRLVQLRAIMGYGDSSS